MILIGEVCPECYPQLTLMSLTVEYHVDSRGDMLPHRYYYLLYSFLFTRYRSETASMD